MVVVGIEYINTAGAVRYCYCYYYSPSRRKCFYYIGLFVCLTVNNIIEKSWMNVSAILTRSRLRDDEKSIRI